MLLPDHMIRRDIALGHIKIDPIEPWMIQPATVDVQLGNELMWYRINSSQMLTIPVDPFSTVDEDSMVRYIVADSFILKPGQFCLATTLQTIGIDDSVAARVEGKSTLGRHGLIVHSTAGFIDPGFNGQITLELSNISNRPLILRPKMPIAQISFMQLAAPVQVPYGDPFLGSHYQGQMGVTPPRAINMVH